jgi:uncharacterized protein YwgA
MRYTILGNLMPSIGFRDQSARQQFLAAIFDRLGNFSMQSLRERIVVQKTIYFLQQFGVYLGYRFTWYVYGPYCPALTKDAFAIWAVPREEPGYRITEGELGTALTKTRELLADRVKDAVWLETLGSLHMLSKMYPSATRDDLIARVRAKAPYFKQAECEQAWMRLRENGLLNESPTTQ